VPDVIYPRSFIKLTELYQVAKQYAGYNDELYGFTNKQKPHDKINHQRPKDIANK
jgi:hypothetical protein